MIARPITAGSDKAIIKDTIVYFDADYVHSLSLAHCVCILVFGYSRKIKPTRVYCDKTAEASSVRFSLKNSTVLCEFR